MGLYLLIWLLLLLFSFKKKTSKTLLWVCAIALILLAGLRDVTIGTDTVTYFQIFQNIEDGSWVEGGWVWLNKVVSGMGGSFNDLLLLVATLSVVPVVIVSLRESPNPHFSLFIFYSSYAYLHIFNGMRQFLAVPIVLLGFSYLYNNKTIRYLICIFIASLVHVSSVIGLLAFFIKKIRLTTLWVYIGVFGSLFAGIFIVSDAVLAPILGPYAEYLKSEVFGFRENLLSTVGMALLLSLFFLAIYETTPKSYRNNFWLKLYWTSIIISNLSLKLVLGTRMVFFYSISQLILFPLYLSVKKKDKSLMACLIVLYLLAFFLKLLVFGNQDVERNIFPYRFYFE